ncbi:RNA polymerase sigma factor [Granulicella cerasi]|uniref:RNA polymerase sigma factor n=1 Tax=Granulicella cerasi TaxID=741063 RepID=A0ABW1ZD83_9BACT|nr:sigma-70 family RNA polymerase sigma factor [Granulicella cerasi]
MKYENDESVARQACNGDERAFEVLSERWRERLLRTAERYTLNRSEAEDAVQSGLFKAWRNMTTFRNESLFSTWITRIVINEVYMIHRRQEHRRIEYSDELTTMEAALIRKGRLPAGESIEERLIQQQSIDQVRSAIMFLPASFRTILQIELTEEVPLPEVAKRLNLSLAAVKSRRLRARRELQKRMSAAASVWHGRASARIRA